MQHSRAFKTLKTLGLILLAILPALLPAAQPSAAQGELVASLEVLSAGVEVQRVDTASWVAIKVETLVGEGDKVRTNAIGEARITFFADGTEMALDPGTEIEITQFRGSAEQYNLSVNVLLGITRQQVGRILDAGSSYEVNTPGARMTVRGTVFALRVEPDGRSSVLTQEGLVAANKTSQTAEVPPGFGLRADTQALSDVVPATTFDELDAALDGCPGQVETDADVRLNVRIGPGLTFETVGTINPNDITTIIGINPAQTWYRIPFRGGYGWIAAAGMAVSVDDAACAALAIYNDSRSEDSTRYGLVGDAEISATVVVETANMRSGPGLEFPIVQVVGAGDVLEVIGKDSKTAWLRVRTPGDTIGWIAIFLVQVNTDLGDVGVVPSTPEEITPTPKPSATPEPTPTPTGE